MPAKSKAQQKFFGLVRSVQKGDTPKSDVSNSVKKAAKSMTKKEVEKFAKTKRKDLPNKITEQQIAEIIKNSVKRILKEEPELDPDYDSFVGKPAWKAIDNVVKQCGIQDIPFEEVSPLIRAISKYLQPLDKCMETALREVYRPEEGGQAQVTQQDISDYMEESMPNLYNLLYKVKTLWIYFGWLIGRR